MRQYSWDETKNRENVAKHGLGFQDARAVFDGACVTFEDTRRDYGEPRSSPWVDWRAASS